MQARWIKQTLILSLGLNCLFLALFFYLAYRANYSHLFFAYRPIEIEKSLSPTLLTGKSCDELVALLSDKTMRQSALATLVAEHDFDLERASPSCSLRRMSDEAYEQIIRFAKKEVYPFTVKGLYNRLPEAAEYFCYTPEYAQVEMLFSRSGTQVPKHTLLSMVAEGKFETLSTYVAQQKLGANYGEERRRDLLLDYVRDGSRTAAYLLLITDFQFAKDSLSDKELMDVLQLLNVKTGEAAQFVRVILGSKRPDEVKKKACERLEGYEGKEVAARFYRRPAEGALEPPWRERHPKALPTNTHVVQPGESLWLIAKKQHVSIEAIMKANNLQSSTIQPGRLLKIPQSTGS